MRPYHFLISLLFLLLCSKVYGQQDVDFKLIGGFLPGKKVLKVKRDYNDPYLWVLTVNNGVYRVNSNTLVIDDYTSSFAAYNNFDFIDIAGFNQNQVFIATNSTNLIAFKNGDLKVFGQAEGLLNVVNSVGITNFGNVLPFGKVVIGTAKGYGLLDPGTYQFSYITGNIQSEVRIFNAGYRSFIYKSGFNADWPQGVAITRLRDFFSIGGEIYPVGGSGTNIKTVYGTDPTIISTATPGYETYFFWGNENGMFQVPFQSINYINPLYGHYLDNISVNKITDIYGLASLGNPFYNNKPNTFTKQNLLIGTAQGLYFSNSIYGQYADGLQSISLQHYNALGNININDICVNGTASTNLNITTGCENGVWVAADNGLYLLKPDYGKFLDPTERLKAIRFNIANSDDVAETSICGGGSIQMGIILTTVQSNLKQWYKDGVAIPGATGTSLTVTTPGDYYATMQDLCGDVNAETNHLKVDAGATPVFTFSYPDKITNCNADPVILKTDNNPAYSYRWYTNGVLNEQNTSLFTVTRSGKYKVEVSACSGTWVASKEVEVNLVQLPDPVIKTDKTGYCAGEPAVLTVNTLLSPDYAINWFKDGLMIPGSNNKLSLSTPDAGSYTVTINSNIAACSKTSAPQTLTFTPAPVFDFNYPAELRYCNDAVVTLKANGKGTYQYRWYKDGALTGDITPSLTISQTGKYKVEVSSCTGSWVPSKEVQVNLVKLPTPVITPDKSAYCQGDQASLSITIPPDPAYTINWYKNGILLAAGTNQTSLLANNNGSYGVKITSNQPNSDGTICTTVSAARSLTFDPKPTVSIQKIIKTTLCDGQSVDLKVQYDNGTIKWSTGDTKDQITVTHSGTYTVTAMLAAGCFTTATTDVTFLPNPVLSIADAAVCSDLHKTVTLTAPAGLKSYVWNGVAGTETFTTDHQQTVTLSVTDANGCTATQDIHITNECPDLKISNTFTPNGDGVNDTWAIAGLANDKTVVVKIFTRLGQVIYNNKGYTKPWNGEYNGKKLPAGVYFYVISAKNASQTYSGSITVIY